MQRTYSKNNTAVLERPQASPRARRITAVMEPPFPLIRRCECGTCHTCRENARWERIFNEKFADPDYYTPREITRGSSLAWFQRS